MGAYERMKNITIAVAGTVYADVREKVYTRDTFERD